MMGRTLGLAVAFAFVVVAAGCSSDPAHYYTLSPTAPSGSAAAKLAVAVGPVSVPAAVDRPQIVVSTSANAVAVDDFNLWASPLQDNIARVVAENLAAILGTPRVSLFPQTIASDLDYRVQIEVRSFESMPGKSATLNAVWTVRRMKDGKTQTGRSSVQEKVSDNGFDALAAAHSRAVGQMSRDIADAILALDRARS
jgi:uncharacterized lipoprotein YmbA